MKTTLLSFMVAFCLAAAGVSETIHVPSDQPTIQAGIDAANPGDVVLVSNGTFVENIDFKGKAITVRSAGGAGITKINGINPVNPDVASVVTFQSREKADSVLEGFTIMGGLGNVYAKSATANERSGGGIFCKNAEPTVIDCIITTNSAYIGGGMSTRFASPTLIRCIFDTNLAQENGGGMHNDYESSPLMVECSFLGNLTNHANGAGIFNRGYSTPVLKSCLFSENKANGSGGGMYNLSSFCDLTSCSFVKNDAYNGCGIYNLGGTQTFTDCQFTDNGYAYQGGGMYNTYCLPTLIRCTFSNNEASEGGGIYNQVADTKVVNSLFIDNSANNRGGAVCNGQASWPEFMGCVFTGNIAGSSGGAVFNRNASPLFTNCTFTGNWVPTPYGGAIHSKNILSRPILTNCILYGNVHKEIYDVGSTTIVTYSNICGGFPGTGNIDAEPLFVDASINDLHLMYQSPCRGTGNNAAPGLPDYDFEGDPRIHEAAVDMGADEFYPRIYVTGDLNPGVIAHCKFIGVPNAVPAALFIGSGLLDPPVQYSNGDFYMESPWYFFVLMPIPVTGVLIYPALVPLTPTAPYQIFLQGLINANFTNPCVVEVVPE